MIATLLDKINIVDIVAEHVATLRDVSTGRRNLYDYALFYAIPIAPVLGMTIYSVRLTDSTIAVLATALSILAGLLFNLLVLLHTLPITERGAQFDGLVKRLLRELHANIAYSIVVSLITLLPLVIASYYGPDDWRRTLMGLVAIYLSVHFSFTMGMVLKRMDTMLQGRLPKK